MEAGLPGKIGMDAFQWVSGVEAEVVPRHGVCLGDGMQHGGRADPGQSFRAFLIENVTAIL
jgi:hypothetical protein